MPNHLPGESLLDYLGHVANMSARERRNPSWRYQSIPELLLDQAGPPRVANTTLPDGFTPGTPKDCFYNAHALAMTHLELVYVEGFAQASVLPVPHAWCLDPSTGTVVDPTWANLTRPTDSVYLGLAFTTGFVARHGLETRSASILETDFLRGHRALQFAFILNRAGQVTGWGKP